MQIRILNKDAINYLYNGIKKSPFWVYRYSASLYEEDLVKVAQLNVGRRVFLKFLNLEM